MLIIIFLGITSALLALFYRNCLKIKGQIFYPIYRILVKWFRGKNKFLSWISKPLGICLYCNTFWVTVLIYLLYTTTLVRIPTWNIIILNILLTTGISHTTAFIMVKTLLSQHPSLAKPPEKEVQIQPKIGYHAYRK